MFGAELRPGGTVLLLEWSQESLLHGPGGFAPEGGGKQAALLCGQWLTFRLSGGRPAGTPAGEKAGAQRKSEAARRARHQDMRTGKMSETGRADTRRPPRKRCPVTCPRGGTTWRACPRSLCPCLWQTKLTDLGMRSRWRPSSEDFSRVQTHTVVLGAPSSCIRARQC